MALVVTDRLAVEEECGRQAVVDYMTVGVGCTMVGVGCTMAGVGCTTAGVGCTTAGVGCTMAGEGESTTSGVDGYDLHTKQVDTTKVFKFKNLIHVASNWRVNILWEFSLTEFIHLNLDFLLLKYTNIKWP